MNKELRSAAQEYAAKKANPRVLLAIPRELERLYYEDLQKAFEKGYELTEYEIFGKRVIAVEDYHNFSCDRCCFCKFCIKLSEHLSLVGEVPCKTVNSSHERYFVLSPGLKE